MEDYKTMTLKEVAEKLLNLDQITQGEAKKVNSLLVGPVSQWTVENVETLLRLAEHYLGSHTRSSKTNLNDISGLYPTGVTNRP